MAGIMIEKKAVIKRAMVTAVGKIIRTKNGFHWGDALRIPINNNHLSCITQQQVPAGGSNRERSTAPGAGRTGNGPETLEKSLVYESLANTT
jgi:hypothetical protein